LRSRLTPQSFQGHLNKRPFQTIARKALKVLAALDIIDALFLLRRYARRPGWFNRKRLPSCHGKPVDSS
jgi:hypothetical protein